MYSKFTLASDTEAQKSDSGTIHGGGWTTFPFIIGTVACSTLAASGWLLNIIVFLIDEFNVKSIDATQISNIINGSICLFPIAGAILADSFLGTFSVISICSCISILGTVVLTLTATIDSLRPQPCLESSLCQSPTNLQYAILYTGLTLASVGLGGMRFTASTLGANQFDKPKDQGVFFNWYFFTFYAASVISATAIVYMEGNVSWGWGFGVCLGANIIGLAIFLSGYRFYRLDKPRGSPFTALARVIVATIWKRKEKVTNLGDQDYYYVPHGSTKLDVAAPKESFRFLNRAALKMEGDVKLDGSIAKPWRLCKVQEVEDFKSLTRILPLWSTTIFLSTPIAIQMSLTVLQAIKMDRHLGPDFKIPPGSFIVVVMFTTSFSLAVIDRFLLPTWQNLFGFYPTPLQRIGLGHVLNILSMVVSAIVETERLELAHNHNHHLMSALWLIPQLILVGLGEAFHFPAQVALYYQEFPISLKSTATAMISIVIGIAYYVSTALVDLVRRVTGWLPDDIDDGRLDNVYWAIVVAGVLNFGYYLVCAKLYKYQNVEKA